MTLATATPDGRPSARIVLLKGVDPRGFVFYTNKQSRKGEELAANPHAALLFHWKTPAPPDPHRGRRRGRHRRRGRRLLRQPCRASPALARGRPTSPGRCPIARHWSGASRSWRRDTRPTRSPARRIGRATGCCPTASSSGRTCRSACTTAASIYAPDGGWETLKLFPVSIPAAQAETAALLAASPDATPHRDAHFGGVRRRGPRVEAAQGRAAAVPRLLHARRAPPHRGAGDWS